MLVFGDPQFEEMLSKFVKRLEARIRSARADSLDDLRALLMEAGQLEQAVSDAAENAASKKSSSLSAAENFSKELTDQIANSFHAAFENRFRAAADFLKLAEAELNRFSIDADFPLTIKIPEGYAFYALFPEQYAVSAARWAKENRTAKKILVVGLRSIGTSLSAVVSATLMALGLKTIRFTIRPRGNPFERTASVAENFPNDFRHALVVDEGPGISGSSMAAAAEALLARGIPRENISFFPGNENPPGSEASEQIRAWWKSAPRFFTPLNAIRWNGISLEQLLLEKSNELCSREKSFETIHDASNGLWRIWAYKNEDDWPAVNIPFERAKFLCSNGSEKILWKFNGFGEKEFLMRSDEIYFPEILGTFHGFTATHWIEGTRLTSRDASPQIVRSIAKYLNDAAGNPLSPAQIDLGIERLAKMLRRNCELVFGGEALCQIELLTESARKFFRENPKNLICRSYGDGRIAPQKWIRADSGKIFKTDTGGHDADHTIIGKQSLLWDIAGVIVEWNLDSNLMNSFFHDFAELGVDIHFDALKFFELSYAAFRMGQSILCAEINSHDVPENNRLQNAFEIYRQQCATRITKDLGLRR